MLAYVYPPNEESVSVQAMDMDPIERDALYRKD